MANLPQKRPTEPQPRDWTADDLAADLAKLGVTPGDILFVHSSLRSLGNVAGGAATVVAALEKAVGPAGAVLMPSFNLVPNDQRALSWNIRSSPSTVGYLTEHFRQMPGTVRSDHYSHSVAARGRNARWFVQDHLSQAGMNSPWDLRPWGACYGTNSPMLRVYDMDGKVLMLGVDYGSSTYMHVVETLYHHHLLASDPKADYRWAKRPDMGAYWDSLGKQSRGRVGLADCRLFRVRDFVDTLLAAGIAEPRRFYKFYD